MAHRQESSPPSPPDTQDDDEALLDALSPVEREALRWSVRLADGLSQADQQVLEAWLAADDSHRAAFEDMAGVWQALDDIPPVGAARLRTTVALDKAARPAMAPMGDAAPNAQQGTTLPHPSLFGERQTAPLPTPSWRQRAASAWRRPASVAATASLALGLLGGAWFGWLHWQQQATFNRDYATVQGQSLTADLPDGSRLLLDTATQASATLYRNRREVRLAEGQVLFQVKGNRAQPFDVLAGAARITVVGTKFMVRYTPSMGTNAVQVAVQEGHVRVARAAGKGDALPAVDLLPGQAVVADAQGQPGPVTAIPVAAVAPWQDQRINFENTPLGDVLAELGRYGPVGLTVADPAVARLPVTASVDLRHVGTFARVLPSVLPVQVHPRGSGFEVTAR